MPVIQTIFDVIRRLVDGAFFMDEDEKKDAHNAVNVEEQSSGTEPVVETSDVPAGQVTADQVANKRASRSGTQTSKDSSKTDD